MGEITKIQWPDIRAEAKRLNELGTLRVRFEAPGAQSVRREHLKRTRCVGFAVDAEERDCLLFLGPYGMTGRFCIRCIPAKSIVDIEILGGKPGPRIDREMTG